MRRPNFDSYYDPPNLDDLPCDICGKFPDDCICPECPICSTQSDPECYLEHGLVRTPSQEASFEAFCKARDDETAAENTYYDQLYEAEQEAKALEEEIEEENKSYYESITNPDRV